MTTPEGFAEHDHEPGVQGWEAIRGAGQPPGRAMSSGPIDGWITVGTGDDQAFDGFDVEARAEHHGHVYGKYDARTHTVLSMDGRTPVTHVRPADGSFRATAEYAADLQEGNDTHRFHAGLERLIGPFS